MYSNEKRDPFIELRAKGLSLARISEQLNITKRTLVEWNRLYADEIRALRAVELEALQEKLLVSYETQLTALAAFQARLDAELATQCFRGMETDKLLRMALLVRKEFRHLREDLQPLDPPKPVAERSAAGTKTPEPEPPHPPAQAEPAVSLPIEEIAQP